MYTLVCIALGLAALILPILLFHLLVRLVWRLISGKWTFLAFEEAVVAHLVVFFCVLPLTAIPWVAYHVGLAIRFKWGF